MLVSHENKFIFIHIPKTAGSSIQKALTPHSTSCPRTRGARLMSRAGIITNRKSFYLPKHERYSYIKRRLGTEEYEKMFSFAFVRNPWDRLVSYYHFVNKTPHHHRNAKLGKLSFDDFVKGEVKRMKSYQNRYIYSEEGELQVDFVGRFENLAEDFSFITQKIGLDIELPHTNSSKHDSYQEYFSDELRELVSIHWEKDIKLFDYSF